jgi:hypothetical protein
VIQVTPHMRVFVAREPLDFRNRIDGTAAICRNRLQQDPMSGALFVFRNRAATMIRVLVYDGQGFWNMTNQPSSHYTSSDANREPWSSLCDARITATRSLSRSHRLQCFSGRTVGSS